MKIGDKVKVINTGGTYPSDQEMANHMGLANFHRDSVPAKDSVGTVIAKHMHLEFDRQLVGVRINDADFILSADAVKVVGDVKELLQCASALKTILGWRNDGTLTPMRDYMIEPAILAWDRRVLDTLKQIAADLRDHGINFDY